MEKKNESERLAPTDCGPVSMGNARKEQQSVLQMGLG